MYNDKIMIMDNQDGEIKQGQDGVVDIHNKFAPPARRKPERTTEPVLLRLSPADAAAIRIAAQVLNMTNSEYVAKLVAVAGDPMKLAREQDRFTDASRIASALAQVPGEVRRLRADLGRLGGVINSFFVRDLLAADSSSRECAGALRAVIDATKKTDSVYESLQENLANVRNDLELAVRQLSGR
jgi:hypothetical protein